jgi:hypothetical protein
LYEGCWGTLLEGLAFMASASLPMDLRSGGMLYSFRMGVFGPTMGCQTAIVRAFKLEATALASEPKATEQASRLEATELAFQLLATKQASQSRATELAFEPMAILRGG